MDESPNLVNKNHVEIPKEIERNRPSSPSTVEVPRRSSGLGTEYFDSCIRKTALIDFSEANSSEDDEFSEDDSPISTWLHTPDSPIYQEFFQRDQSLPALIPVLTELSVSELVARAAPGLLEFGRSFILLQTPSTILQRQKQTFVHSWCDISATVGIDATRTIPSFFNDRYEKLDPVTRAIPHFGWVSRMRGFRRF
jgi:hypothetical protein